MTKHLVSAFGILVTAYVATAQVAPGIQAQNHSHSHSNLKIVDGKKNPELVSDELATRVLITSLFPPPARNDYEDKLLDVKVRAIIGLSEEDIHTLLNIVNLRSEEWNVAHGKFTAAQERAKSSLGISIGPIAKAKEDADVVLASIYSDIRKSLSPKGMATFTAYIRSIKSNIRYATSPASMTATR